MLNIERLKNQDYFLFLIICCSEFVQMKKTINRFGASVNTREIA